MTKAERVAAAIAGKPIDRVPVAFWRHAPDVDHTAKGLAEAMLAFHRRWDLDLINPHHRMRAAARRAGRTSPGGGGYGAERPPVTARIARVLAWTPLK